MAFNHLPEQTALVTLPPAFPPAPTVLRILARHDREHLAAFITVAIDLMDAMDGDIDAENATDLEDDFQLSHIAHQSIASAPGCPVADSDRCDARDDDLGAYLGDNMPGDADDAELIGDEKDSAWCEWQTLPASTRRSGAFESQPVNSLVSYVLEDDEDDDGDTGVEDHPEGFDAEEDQCPAGDDGCAAFIYAGRVHYGHADEDGDCEGWRQPLTLNPA